MIREDRNKIVHKPPQFVLYLTISFSLHVYNLNSSSYKYPRLQVSTLISQNICHSLVWSLWTIILLLTKLNFSIIHLLKNHLMSIGIIFPWHQNQTKIPKVQTNIFMYQGAKLILHKTLWNWVQQKYKWLYTI